LIVAGAGMGLDSGLLTSRVLPFCPDLIGSVATSLSEIGLPR
jgi:hypothetical protein